MPCYDSEDDRHSLHNDINHLTNLLCEACKILGTTAIIKHGSLKLNDWWNGHLASDAAEQMRKEKEKKRRLEKEKVLRKLTPEEKKILGV